MEGQDRRHHAALFGARVRELSAVDAWHRDRRHRAVSTWRRAGGPGFDLRYLRQLRMALHIGSWAVGLGAFLIAPTFRPFARIEARSAAVPASASQLPI